MVSPLRPRRDQRREAIVEGALRLFSERGTLPVRVEDIAEAVGISRATFYKYFSERDEILAELFRRLFATAPSERDLDGSVADRVTALLVGNARRMAEQERLARFVYTRPLRHDALLVQSSVRPLNTLRCGDSAACVVSMARGAASWSMRSVGTLPISN